MPSAQTQLQINDLISTVGTSGRYQNIITVICCFLLLQNGMIFLTSGYNYAVAPYDQCLGPYSGVAKCTQYVCSLPVKERSRFMNPQIAALKTIGNQYGDYHCKKEFQISLGMGMLWIGALIGSAGFPMLADNWGRRISILLAQLLGISGLLITLLAPNLLIAQVGMLIVGASLAASFVIVLCILREVLDPEQIQKVTIWSQLFVPIGAILVISAYPYLKDWKLIFLGMALIPQLICLIFSYYYFQQTPQFLIKLAPVQQIMDSLQFMAEQNGLKDQLLNDKKITLEYLEDLKEKNTLEQTNELTLSHWTMCLVPSLRLKTICIFIINFCISCFYFIPFLMVNKFGFNFYINGIMLAVSDIASFPLISFAIKYQRKRVFYVTAFIIFACSLALLFLMQGKMCTSNCNSGEKIAELVLFFILLFSGAMIVEVSIIYMYELFPVQVTALGMATSQNAKCFSNIFMPSVLLLFNAINVPAMSLFILMGLVFVGAVYPLPETLGADQPELTEQKDPFERNDSL